MSLRYQLGRQATRNVALPSITHGGSTGTDKQSGARDGDEQPIEGASWLISDNGMSTSSHRVECGRHISRATVWAPIGAEAQIGVC